MLTDAKLEQILLRIPHLTVGVLGDLFLDRYLDIDLALTETSIETGLYALQVVGVRPCPGASGTVINNLAALGVGRILPIAVIGDDGEGYELRQALTALGVVSLDSVFTQRGRRTPTYTKPMLHKGHGPPREFNRLDIKNRAPLPPEAEEKVLVALAKVWPKVDVLLVLDQVSEAECGVVTARVREVLEEFGERDPNKVVLADSRERVGLFRSVWVKPNFDECRRAANGPDHPKCVMRLARLVGRPVFCTYGEHGILIADPRPEAQHQRLIAPAYPVTGPTDPVGAGDSTSAGIACALAAGATLAEAAAFGNLVASITIQQIGTTGTATPEQVRTLARGAFMSEAATPAPAGWLNRNVLGAGLTSLLADACYETATAILPGFLAVLGERAGEAAPFAVAALWVGLMEGLADGVSTSVKLGGAWWSERVGHRKAVVTFGYALTGAATVLFAVAPAAWFAVLGRVVAWLGRGIRGPLRDAILADSVDPANRGKVFGFHRAGDTVGAVLGPLLGAALLGLLPEGSDGDPTRPYRIVFLLALIPGVGAALAFALMVRERHRGANPAARLWASVRALPRDFRRALVGVGVFGAGDFAPVLLVLAAAMLLTPEYGATRAAQVAALLYALRNVLYAAASYPVGAVSDRYGRRGLLAGGYALGAAVTAGFAVALGAGAGLPVLAVLFALAGCYVAFEDALSGALTADLVPDAALRGTAYGVMGTVKGLGDVVSSVTVGVLWYAFGPVPGFAAAAALMLAGAVLLYRVR